MKFPIYVDSTAELVDESGSPIMAHVVVEVKNGKLVRHVVAHPERFTRVVEMLIGEHGLAPTPEPTPHPAPAAPARK